MTSAAQAVRPKAAPEPVRRSGASETRRAGAPETRRAGASETRRAGAPETRRAGAPETRRAGAPEAVRRAGASEARHAPAATPRYLRASLRLGGINDPEEHEAERAASTIASGGCHRVVDPGGSVNLRAAHDGTPVRAAHDKTPVRAFSAPPLLDTAAAGRVRRAPAGTAAADQAAAARIEHARAGVARPLPPAVQARLEHGFGERMDGVRLHTGPAARAAARSIGARAYTEGERITLGPGESEHDVHLMAHEATHVVQNRRAAGIARALPDATPARAAPQTDVRRAASQDVRRTAEQPIRRFPGLSTLLDKFADWANVIPGYRLLTIILGMNPINQEKVERSGANILRAAVELIPGGGLIVKALEQYGIFEKGGAWLEQQVAALGMTGSALWSALMDFLDSLGLSDIFHPGDVWDRAKRIFSEPIDRLIAFFKAVAEGIIALIKDAILKPLAALASGTRAWDLLCAVLGKNPITGEPVERSPETLIGGFMKLAGQEEAWANIQKANALQRCWAWFQTTMSELLGFVAQVPGLFIAALKSFQISDLLDLPGALVRVAGMFGDFVGQFISWALTAVWHLLEIVIDAVSPGALTYIKKTGAALKSILKNPMPFVGNLVKAAKLGLSNFKDNFLTHLKEGLIDWLTGSLPGVYIPKALSLPEVGKFALSLLGVSWAQIRAKIVKALGPNGEKIMQGLETAFDVVKALVTGGPAAAWEVIKEKLTGLKDMVFDAIASLVMDTIIKKAIPKLISMFIPGAGFISAILSIYDTVTTFVRQLSKIAAAVKAFVDSIVAIAQGQIDGAAALVEQALAGVLAIAINLLAGFLSLGGIAAKVRDSIGKVWGIVDKALDTAVTWIVTKAKSLFAKLFGKADDKGDDDKSRAVKKKVAGELAGKTVKNAQDEQQLLSSVYSRFSAEGLIGIRFAPSKEGAGKIDVFARASAEGLITKLDMDTPAGVKALAAIAGRMNVYAGRTTIIITDGMTNQPLRSPVTQKLGQPGHAEMWLRLAFPNMMDRIRRQRAKLGTPATTPVLINLDINRTPCDGCTESHLQAIIEGLKTAYPDVPVQLKIAAASVSRGAQITTEARIVKLLQQGVEIVPSTVWDAIKSQMQAASIKQIDYGQRSFDIDDVNQFIAEAAEVQDIIDKATKLMKQDQAKPIKLGE